MIIYHILSIIILLCLFKSLYINVTFLNIVTKYKEKTLYYRGLGGMSNIILGYYSTVYLSILMNRNFKMKYIRKLNKYYKMPDIFFTNDTIKGYKIINENSITSQFAKVENDTFIYISTCHDILENIIPLCVLNITKCLFINLKNKNLIHELYKLRRQLIAELLVPKSTLLYTYKIFKKKNIGFLIGIHIRTSIYSDFKERDLRFYNNETEKLYIQVIDYVIKKYLRKNKKLYIISDSRNIKYKFKEKYNKYILKDIFSNNTIVSHSINDMSIIEQYLLSKCNVIIGSCASTFTLLSVFRYLNEYYAIEGLLYSGRGKIRGKCGYELDYNHHLFTKS